MSEHLELPEFVDDEVRGGGVDPGLMEPAKNEKEIDVLDSMMKLFDQVKIFFWFKLEPSTSNASSDYSDSAATSN